MALCLEWFSDRKSWVMSTPCVSAATKVQTGGIVCGPVFGHKTIIGTRHVSCWKENLRVEKLMFGLLFGSQTYSTQTDVSCRQESADKSQHDLGPRSLEKFGENKHHVRDSDRSSYLKASA
jgi:hypothetical protein